MLHETPQFIPAPDVPWADLICGRAAIDRVFRERLLSDPESVLTEMNVPTSILNKIANPRRRSRNLQEFSQRAIGQEPNQ